ncbi:MAG: sensor domain-containing protein [Bordetella sp.]|uniref:sensor domain-containing protein n=1 Tax=Bordetella sp. TaxID=28081 RepID=UPI003F7CB3C2
MRPLIGRWRWHIPSKTGTCSKKARKILNLAESASAPDRQQIRQQFDDTSWEQLTCAAKAAIETGSPNTCQLTLCQPDGACKWIRIHIRPHANSDGRVCQLSGSVEDITKEKESGLALDSLGWFIDSISDGITDWNLVTGKVFYSARFYEVLGMRPESDGGPLPFRDRLFPQDQDRFVGAVQDHLASRSSGIDVDFRVRHADDPCRRLRLRGKVVSRDKEGKPLRLIGILTDISDHRLAGEDLPSIARTSRGPASSRRQLSERLEDALAQAGASGRLVGVCFIDLDRFKSINDEYGYAAGDSLLSRVAGIIKSSIRSADTLARPGGDEFIVILNQLESIEECRSILDRILRNLYQGAAIEGGYVIKASASIGVTLFPYDNADADALIRHADQAMYAAKEAGKGGYVIFDPEGERKLQRRNRELVRLQEAISGNELVLHYQPKVDLATGQIKGVEALVRWRHPDLGLLLPGQFLPRIAGHQLEFALDYWVLKTAIEQCRTWLCEGRSLAVSINVSAALLQKTDFYDSLFGLLRREPPVPAALIELEVLETSAISDIDKTVHILTQCRQMGVRVALDDFGTGYSSLSYLRELPLDTLKIDQSFVRDMLVDSDDLALVDGTIKLAHAFDLDVVAEGVESEAHGQKLIELGCVTMQGFGIGRPMPPDDLVDWLVAWTARRAGDR